MEIRTLKDDERNAALELLDGWALPDGWKGREFFRRPMDHDPTFSCENVWVAAEGGSLHGCVQIFPRRLRVLGHAVPTGGIGSVYTRPESRGSGVSTALLERSVSAMEERGMELSLLFAARTAFYEKRGWQPWKVERTVLRKAPDASDRADAVAKELGIELAPFDRDRDMRAVQAIHSAYSANRNGTVVRDERLWEASLVLAGNPDEEFWVARKDGFTIAYARATRLNDMYTITELARLEEGAGALAALIQSFLTPRDGDPLVPAGKSSGELRAFALTPSFDDISFTVALENAKIRPDPMDDRGAMLRCLNVEALARRMDVTLLPGEDGARFLTRILPPEHFVFWPSDRF